MPTSSWPSRRSKDSAWLCAALRDAGLGGRGGAGLAQDRLPRHRGLGAPGPRIAFLCEYDGLPVYGQSWVTMSGGRPVSARPSALPRSVGTLGGTAMALGTPGEEGGGGKNILHREGFFEGLDAMMLVYPGMDNIAHSRTVGATRVQVAYFGKAAHAAARPELGINALDALLLALERHCLRCASSCRPTCACTGSSPRAARCPRSFPTTHGRADGARQQCRDLAEGRSRGSMPA